MAANLLQNLQTNSSGKVLNLQSIKKNIATGTNTERTINNQLSEIQTCCEALMDTDLVADIGNIDRPQKRTPNPKPKGRPKKQKCRHQIFKKKALPDLEVVALENQIL